MRDISYTTTTATRQPDRRRLVIFNDAASASTNGTDLQPKHENIYNEAIGGC